MSAPGLSEAARVVREACLAFDALAEATEELDFALWSIDTVWPQAVDRWIADLGGCTWNR